MLWLHRFSLQYLFLFILRVSVFMSVLVYVCLCLSVYVPLISSASSTWKRALHLM